MHTTFPSGYARRGYQSYQKTGLEIEVMSASPERLISLLFLAALRAIRQARHHLDQKQDQARGRALSKAIEIIESGLKASIDEQQGGQIAQSLITNYELIIEQLLLANLRKSALHLQQAEQSLSIIAQAWHQAIDPQYRGFDTLLDPPVASLPGPSSLPVSSPIPAS